jgi:hypothetical protein
MFAFQKLFTNDIGHDDLYSLKDEVKEFRLHNIIVKNYFDMRIEFSEFLKENYWLLTVI